MNCMFKKFQTINDVSSQSSFKIRGRPPARQLGQVSTLEDAALLLKEQGAAVAVLAVQDLQSYWLSIMQDKKASTKDKLTASKFYAQSIGAFDAKQLERARQPKAYGWADADVIDAEQVPNEDAEDAAQTRT